MKLNIIFLSSFIAGKLGQSKIIRCHNKALRKPAEFLQQIFSKTVKKLQVLSQQQFRLFFNQTSKLYLKKIQEFLKRFKKLQKVF